MSMSKRKPKAAPVENLQLDPKEGETPLLQNRMDDLPPEVLTIILDSVILNETSNKALYGYRRVNRQWKEIMDTLVEKKILSGDSKVFQRPIKIMKRRPECDQLHVQTGFQTGETPFLFNSLFLHGTRTRKERFSPDRSATLMTLPAFVSTFGGNVTSFSLHNQVIPITSFASMLGSIPGLKLLRLLNVKQEERLLKFEDLQTPPSLPNLTTLETKSTENPYGGQTEVRTILYVWLIASYADQLLSLELDTHDPVPALQKQHQYSVRVSKKKTLSIATTLDSAFGNLKELKLSRARKDFLINSVTPALQQLSVFGVYDCGHINITHLLRFVLQCGSTLEKLSLDVTWKDLLNFEEQSAAVGFRVVPKLKALAIHYPSEDFPERILRERLLAMFPAVEVIQLLHFCPHNLDKFEVEDIGDGENEIGRGAIDPIALKERSALIRQRLIPVEAALFGAGAWRFQARAVLHGELDPGVAEDMQLIAEVEELVMTDRKERAGIFKRLAALGEKREKVIVEELLDRQGIWITCPNLKILSVSSGGTPEGDVCVIRRTNDA